MRNAFRIGSTEKRHKRTISQPLQLIRSVLFFGALAASFSLQAAITSVTVEGASGFDSDDRAIFGGLAGDACVGDTTSTCANCTSGTAASSFVASCNDNRIYSTLQLRINVVSDSTTGFATIADSDGTSNANFSAQTNTGSVSSGSTATVTLTWSLLCLDILSNSDCETPTTSGSNSFSVGISTADDDDLDDSDDDRVSISVNIVHDITGQGKACTDSSLAATDGLCGFQVFPGDEKVFIQTLQVPSGFPTSSSGVAFTKVRFYVAESSTAGDASVFSAINNSSTFFEVDVELQDSGEVSPSSDNFSDGISNGSTYYFAAKTVDAAGNVGFALDSSLLNTSDHSATPSTVFALLSEDVECFIATAAFGSKMSPHVHALRIFRDRYLKTNSLGQAFVDFYYEVSPPIARWIYERAWARKAVRALLWPAVGFAYLSLDIGLMIPMLFSILTLALVFFFVRRVLQKKSEVEHVG